jgi:hypothetical protein
VSTVVAVLAGTLVVSSIIVIGASSLVGADRSGPLRPQRRR